MEHIAAILLLVGCSGDLKQCEELPAPTAIYETDEDCQADLKPSIALLSGRQARIFGTCVYVDPALEEQDAELVWDIAPDGKLTATVEAPSLVLADNAQRGITAAPQ